ncbi:MAG: hypothetical protein HQL05_10600 [Nitrospirae bacterium]|uniref:hypothetical protein n=1 Tax=Candidatus Magnetobacterium casense TaxID=1455061 RepID=UPI00058B2070|nr:hypothetical protein [Candidatus Magnetobacterium casensis]MBF0338268.1 hypothetical protein [Nitrospirota bacterium]
MAQKNYFDVINFIRKEYNDGDDLKNEWVKRRCSINPEKHKSGIDEHPSLSIHTETGNFNCFVCGEKGKPENLLVFSKKCSDVKEAKDYLTKNYPIIRKEYNRDEISDEDILEIYAYRDIDNSVAFEILRLRPNSVKFDNDPKPFKCRRYNSKKKCYEYNMHDVKRIPYNLPNIISSQLVFKVEGEKDANTLIKLGFIATTNTFGANGWTKELNKYFKDKDVVILPDQDIPGERHGRIVATNLHHIARSIKIVNIPDAKDISDVVELLTEQGKSLEEIREYILSYISGTKDWVFTFDNALFNPSEYIVVGKFKPKLLGDEILKDFYFLNCGNTLYHYKDGIFIRDGENAVKSYAQKILDIESLLQNS